MTTILASADPTELGFAARACHVVACTILRDRGIALDAIGNQQVSESLLTLPLCQSASSLTSTLVPGVAAFEASTIGAISADHLTLAAASGFMQHRVARFLRTSLKVLIGANIDILQDSLIDSEQVLRAESLNVLFLESLCTPTL